MRAEITFNGDGTAASRYVGWAPVPAQVRLSDPTDATGPVTVSLQNQSITQVGQVVFFSAIPGTAQDDLDVTLPLAGTPVQFILAGRFQRPSNADRDVNIQNVNSANNQAIGTASLMVRVRKDANTLSTAERNRLLAAFATLNDAGMGRFADFATCTAVPGTRRRTRTPVSLRGIGPTCWIWSGSCSVSTRASLSPTGVSTSRHPIFSPETSWALPT